MKRIIALSLFVSIILLSAGCLRIRPREADVPDPADAPAEQTIVQGAGQTSASPVPDTSLKLETVDGGFYSVQLPEGWQISTVGQYVTFGFRAWDPQNPSYQIFYYGKFEPLLKSYAAKQYYMDTAASLAPGNMYEMYADAPALEPMTAESLLFAFNDWALFANNYGVIHQFTTFQNLNVIGRLPYSTCFASVAADEGMVLAQCRSPQGEDCLVKFGASVVSAGSYPLSETIDTFPLSVYFVSGVLAPETAFADVEQILTQAAFSLRFSQKYMEESVAATQAGTADALAANAALQEVYDAANAAWDAYIRD